MLLLHAAQLVGEGAAVDAQIVRQLLPIIGDGEFVAAEEAALDGPF